MTGTDRVELEWGLRRSFVAYVERLPDGVVRASGDAVRDGDVFRLPGRRLASGGFAFDGVLRFSAHAGVLDVTLDAIRVEAGELSAVVAGTRVPIAELGASAEVGAADADAVVARFDSVVLGDDGAAVLGGVYPVGASADPVTVRRAPAGPHS